jgi:hypothetical protein
VTNLPLDEGLSPQAHALSLQPAKLAACPHT